ncbi:MAG TPA: metal-sensing transcriptional repressor [Actinomycetes bacterium]|jgi:DNA-binding FrmR family transcriptional regulator|nr:metal-sensing transcriptional repressor [Actinomycetes bacterium]
MACPTGRCITGRCIREGRNALTQTSAVDKAPTRVAVELLDDHLRHCVRDGVASNGPQAETIVTEAAEAVARLVHA